MRQRFVFALQRILAPGAGHRCHPSAEPAGDGGGKGKGWRAWGLGMLLLHLSQPLHHMQGSLILQPVPPWAAKLYFFCQVMLPGAGLEP